MTPAPLWRRVAAMLYDSVVIIAIWMVVGFVVTAAFGIEGSRSVEQGVISFNPFYRVAMFAAMLGSAYLFFGWFWTHSGQTIGMQAWKIKVENGDGAAINWKQVTLRCVTAPFALGLVGIGYFWMWFDAGKRVWPDIASGSVVAKIENFPKGEVPASP
jgi:uncharacterized RDD family membrane protein YckC